MQFHSIITQLNEINYRWAFRVLSVNKDAQRQIQDEIDRVVGERDVMWEDRHK